MTPFSLESLLLYHSISCTLPVASSSETTYNEYRHLIFPITLLTLKLYYLFKNMELQTSTLLLKICTWISVTCTTQKNTDLRGKSWLSAKVRCSNSRSARWFRVIREFEWAFRDRSYNYGVLVCKLARANCCGILVIVFSDWVLWDFVQCFDDRGLTFCRSFA